MTRRPNILIINLDQLRYDCLGCTGNPLVRTPHIDALAQSGLQFDSAFTPFPVCAPARQTLLTGVMPEQHGGIWNFDRGGGLPVQAPAPADCAVWVQHLRDTGYRTAYLGKWHVHPAFDPTAFGYETYVEPTTVSYDPKNWTRKFTLSDDPWPEFPVGAVSTLDLEASDTHVMADACSRIIREFSAGDAPWHIRLDFNEPHLPCIPCEPFASMVPPESIPPWENFAETFAGKPFIQQQQLRNWRIEAWTWYEWSVYLSGYYGMISQLDDAIGRVIETLRSASALDNTLIIFTTDHGDAAGSHCMMDKHYVMYDEEVHVPLICSWPGVIPAGGVCHDFVSHFLDLPVTLLELIGLPVPETYQGRSFLPQLEGRASEDPRPFAFSSYNGQQFGLYCQRMVRDRKYKYVWNATDIDECYDLENDPHELVNLAADERHDALCRSYRQKVHEVFTGLKDPLVLSRWNERWLREG
jgi:arylsulfatase A-like enzyme